MQKYQIRRIFSVVPFLFRYRILIALLIILDVGKKVNQAGTVGAVESVKSASDIYSPLSGEVLEVNENLKVNNMPVYTPFMTIICVKVILKGRSWIRKFN